MRASSTIGEGRWPQPVVSKTSSSRLFASWPLKRISESEVLIFVLSVKLDCPSQSSFISSTRRTSSEIQDTVGRILFGSVSAPRLPRSGWRFFCGGGLPVRDSLDTYSCRVASLRRRRIPSKHLVSLRRLERSNPFRPASKRYRLRIVRPSRATG
jgi:hypothetical protein